MKWAELTKEQKQMAVLIGVVGVTAVSALFQFVLKPAFENAEEARVAHGKLYADIAKADSELKQEPRVARETLELRQELDRAGREYIPPYGNAMAWATEELYTLARRVGVNIESLSGGAAWGGAPAAGQKGGRTFVSFSAQIALQCSYADLLRFLQALEQDNPLASVTGVSIEGREQNPEKQRVTLSVEWPTWAQPPAAGGKAK